MPLDTLDTPDLDPTSIETEPGLEGEGGHVICACGYFLIFLGYQKMLGVVWDPQTRTADG